MYFKFVLSMYLIIRLWSYLWIIKLGCSFCDVFYSSDAVLLIYTPKLLVMLYHMFFIIYKNFIILLVIIQYAFLFLSLWKCRFKIKNELLHWNCFFFNYYWAPYIHIKYQFIFFFHICLFFTQFIGSLWFLLTIRFSI